MKFLFQGKPSSMVVILPISKNCHGCLQISKNSFIEVNGNKISIVQVNLEEDSAKNTGTKNGIKHYRLDRLGTPLIEIATKSRI